MIYDINGKEIIKGCKVLVHQDEEQRIAKVIEVFPDNKTSNKDGCWIDIDFGDGIEGMMSYILEVVEN